MISLRGIGKSFPGVQALKDISFDFRDGELHAICGENGAGKSTLMKILSGVYTDYDGTIEIDGQEIRFQGTRDAERAGISIIHQELNLVEQLSVAANIFLGREARNSFGFRDEKQMIRRAGELLKDLECNIDPRTRAGALRVGDQQLVEIAKALSLNSRLLIMDEPTSALTESEVARLYRVIDKLQARGTTIVYISHKMEEVFRLSNRITVLRDGRFIETVNTSETDANRITQSMVGRELALETGVNSDRMPGPVVLSVRNLGLAWPGHARGYRLKDISFDLHRGEVLGIAGLMGAGRTELLESLFGASTIRPTGTIQIEGKEVRFSHPSEAMKQGIALVTEDRKRLGLFPAMDVGRNISMCSLLEARRSGLLSRGAENGLGNRMVDKLKVKTAGLRAAITGLSGGNQQKCIVGRWLLTEPKILLLDDPTRGVDVGAKAELYRIIRELCAGGLGVIVTSSELPEVLTLSDRIMVLNEGRQAAMFDRKDATQDNIIRAATA
ncbi:MAG: sugar ABC transporter ATP-binding protein [Pirellula sp.]|jgi:ABC-type sugar transport system ATPase subunit